MQWQFRIDRNGRHDMKRLFIILLAVSGCAFQYHFVYKLSDGDTRTPKRDLSTKLLPSTENVNNNESAVKQGSFLYNPLSLMHYFNRGEENTTRISKDVKNLKLEESRRAENFSSEEQKSNKGDVEFVLKNDKLAPRNPGSQENLENQNHYLGLGFLNYRRGIGLHGPDGMAQDQQMFLAQPLPANQPGNSISNNQPGSVNNQNEGISTLELINLIKDKTGGKLDSNSVLEIVKKILVQKQSLGQQPQQSINQVSEVNQDEDKTLENPLINSNEERYMNENSGYTESVNNPEAVLQNNNDQFQNLENSAISEVESNAMLGDGFIVNENSGGTFDFQNDDGNLQQDIMSAELDHLFGVGPATLNFGGDASGTGQLVKPEIDAGQGDGSDKELDALFSDQVNNIQSLDNPSQEEGPHENTFEGGGDLDEIFGNSGIQSPNQPEQENDGDAELYNIFGDTPNVVEAQGIDNLAEVLLDTNVEGSNELDDIFGNNGLESPGENDPSQGTLIDRANENVVENEGMQALDDIFNDNVLASNSISPGENDQSQETLTDTVNENVVENEGMQALDDIFNDNVLASNSISPGENEVPSMMLDRVRENIGNYQGDEELDALFNDNSGLSPGMIDRVQENAINNEGAQELENIFNDNMDLGGIQTNEVHLFDGGQSLQGIPQDQNEISPNLIDRVKENVMNIEPNLELDAIFGNDNNGNPTDISQDKALEQLLNGFEEEEVPEDDNLNHELHDLFNSNDNDNHDDILDADTFLQEYIANGMNQDNENEEGKVNNEDGDNVQFNSNEEIENLFSDNYQKESDPSVNLNRDLKALEGDFFNSLNFDSNGMMGGPNPVNPNGDLSTGRDLLGLSLNDASAVLGSTDGIVGSSPNQGVDLINHNDIDSLIFGSNSGREQGINEVNEAEKVNIFPPENVVVKETLPSEQGASQEVLSNIQKMLLNDNEKSQDSAINDLDAILNTDTKLNDNSISQQSDSQNLEQLLLGNQADSGDSALLELEKLISGGSKQIAGDTSSDGSVVSQDLEKILFGNQETQDSALDEFENLMTGKTKQSQANNKATNEVSLDRQSASQDLEKLLFGNPEGEDAALSELDKLMSGGPKSDSQSNNLQQQKVQDLRALLFNDQAEDSALLELDKAMGGSAQKPQNPPIQNQAAQDLEALLFGDQGTESDSALMDLDKAMGASPQKPPNPPTQNQAAQDLEALLFGDQGTEGDAALMDLDKAMGASPQKPQSSPVQSQGTQDLASLLFQDPGKDSALDELDNLFSSGNSKPVQSSGVQSEGQNLESILFGNAGNDAGLDGLDGLFAGNEVSQSANPISENTNNVQKAPPSSNSMQTAGNPFPGSDKSGSSLPTLYEAYSEGGIISGLKAGEKEYLLNEKPIRILSGSIHYFRVHPNYWRDRLQKLRAAGFNTVETLVPWALHEPAPKQAVFKSFYVDLRKFITIAKEEDLLVILRPGPYVSAEFDFGGMPSWLLENSVAKLRTPHPSFYLPAKQYLIRLSKLVIDLVWSTLNGAQPVIIVQIENDYTIYGASLIRDQKYIEGLKRVMVEAGLKDVMFTVCNSPRDITKSRLITGLTQTVSYSGDPTYPLHVMNSVAPNSPIFFMEFKTGRAEIWGEPHHPTSNLTEFLRNFEYILSNGSSVNMYMFHGGTTPGFYTGGSSGHFDGIPEAIGNSYDYDAPLNEAGDYTSKYWALRKLTQKYKFGPEVRLPSVPPTAKKTAFRATPIRQYITCFDLVNSLNKKYEKENPIFVEDLAPDVGNVGFVLYRKTDVTLASMSLMKILADVHDGFYVMIDEKYVEAQTKPPIGSTMFNQIREYQYALEGDDKGGHTIDILVENQGRGYRRVFHDQHKGMKGTINIDGTQITNWLIFPIDFSPSFLQTLKSWKDLNDAAGPKPGPTLYRTSLMILRSQIADTFVDFSVQDNPWTKGLVFVNGYNLGRYWKVGPSHSLFLPGHILKPGLNEFFIFELLTPGETIYFDVEGKLSEIPEYDV